MKNNIILLKFSCAVIGFIKTRIIEKSGIAIISIIKDITNPTVIDCFFDIIILG